MKKFIALTLLTVLLTACTPSGEDLQGRFGSPTKEWTMALSPDSPKGAHDASENDDVLLFDMTLSSKNVLDIGSTFEVYFSTDAGLDPLADGTVVNLEVDGKIVGTGTFKLVDPSIPNEGTALITTTREVNFKGGKTKTFTVNTDTDALLAKEDKMSVGVEYNGKSVDGNELVY